MSITFLIVSPLCRTHIFLQVFFEESVNQQFQKKKNKKTTLAVGRGPLRLEVIPPKRVQCAKPIVSCTLRISLLLGLPVFAETKTLLLTSHTRLAGVVVLSGEAKLR